MGKVKVIIFRTLVLMAALCGSVQAADVTLISGYHFNSGFEISATNNTLASSSGAETGKPGDEVALDDAIIAALAVDFEYNNDASKRMGFYVSHEQTKFASNAGLANPDLDITHVHWTSMSYYPEGDWEPFIIGGLGVGIFSPADDSLKDEIKISGQLGGGTNYKITENLLLRLDVRWIATFFNGSGAVFCDGGCAASIQADNYSQIQTSLGLMFRF